ncbi:MAG: DNA topoisomerase subunit B [Candidatus Saccharibacteria bacterium]|nr:DNA topoisomerase subunit B [Candidatus Saccharibacteria bacterium]
MSTKKSQSTNQYSSDSIQVLEGLEPVRKRPGMYIGSTGLEGLHHMVKEVADNGIDEALAGFASEIKVTLLADGGVKVEDNGRGIPVGKHAKTNKSALETIMTVLHAGGKFDDSGYKVSSGLHGVGISVVNALASKLIAEVHREGSVFKQEYAKGKPKTKVEKIGASDKTGTIITYWPDYSIMKKEELNPEVILDYLRHQAYLTKGVKTLLVDEKTNLRGAFYFEGGIQSYVRHLNYGKDIVGEKVFYVDKIVDKISVEVALQYNDGFNEIAKAFANNVFNSAGGAHLVGFRTALTRVLNDYARSNSLLKEKDENLTGEDVREGLTAVILVKISDPQFEGQTKNKLGNPEVRGVVEKTVNEYLGYFLAENPKIGQGIIAKAILSARARRAARAARDNIIRKGVLEGASMPGKLWDCSSRNPAESELFIVEGDSAGGSAKTGRDSKTQAILPLRGKVLNVERARLDKMLANKEIVALIKAIGVGIDEQFDLEALRYHKIIIMTDADVDGSHIATLLMTFFFRYMRPVIEAGHLYLSQPPTHALKLGKKIHYIYSDDEYQTKLEKLVAEKTKKSSAKNSPQQPSVELNNNSSEAEAILQTTLEKQAGVSVTRFKGLGEMDAEQLWETTMDPANRILLQIKVEDAEKADAVFNKLMGEEVELRKNFIQTHAKFVKDLDI